MRCSSDSHDLRLASPLVAPAEYFHEGEPQKAGENQHQRGRGGGPDLPLVSKTPGPGSKGFKIEGPEHEAQRSRDFPRRHGAKDQSPKTMARRWELEDHGMEQRSIINFDVITPLLNLDSF